MQVPLLFRNMKVWLFSGVRPGSDVVGLLSWVWFAGMVWLVGMVWLAGMVWLEGSVVVGVGSGGNGKLMGGRGSSPSSED